MVDNRSTLWTKKKRNCEEHKTEKERKNYYEINDRESQPVILSGDTYHTLNIHKDDLNARKKA